MVEAVSGSQEGIDIPVSPIEEVPAKEIQKEESLNESSSKDQLKRFLDEGGAQEKYLVLLKTLYGDKVIERTFPKSWKENLTKEQCLEIIARIGQGVTLDDLEGYYAEIKSGAIKSEVLRHVMVPYYRMWRVNSVKELPPYWLGQFIDHIRNPLEELHLEKKSEWGSTVYTYYDHAVKRLEKNGDRSRPEFFYGSRELLAKTVAYAKPQHVHDGAIIPIYNEKLGRLVYYTLKGQVHDTGLHAYLFIPLESGEDLPAQLIFRGTNGYASANRDLDPQGVGSWLKG